jgi:hypothetical protein
MTTVIVTAKALLLNLGTGKATEVSSGAIPEDRVPAVLSRIKKSEIVEKTFHSLRPGMQLSVKWDGDIVKIVFRCESLPIAFFHDVVQQKPSSPAAVYVRGKKGVEYEDKDVKDKAVYKAVLDEFQAKIVYPKAYKKAVLRTKTTTTDPPPPQDEHSS